MRAACLAGVVVLAAFAPAAAQPAKIGLGAWEHFEIWLDAIDGHVAGAQDDAVRAMLELSASELESLFPYMVFALRDAFALTPTDRHFAVDDFFGRYGTRGHAPTDLARLRGPAARILRGGIDRFLKRAAMLHADIGMVAPNAHRSNAAGVGHRAQDGRGAGDEGRTWHWMLGRAFLHLVHARDHDPHVRLWYQATGSHLVEIHDFTEAQPHLARALEMFSGDAEIQFLRGFMHEAQAWSGIQAAVEAQIARMPPVERARYTPGVRSADAEQADALEAFRKAVQLDAGHHDARIRFGRALTLAGDAERAAAELRAALERTDNQTQRYLAHLFLGRAEEIGGRFDAARAAYEGAAALYPHAQSPRLALSQLALRAGDRKGGAAMLAGLAEPEVEDADPWWYYFERVPAVSVWSVKMWDAFREAIR